MLESLNFAPFTLTPLTADAGVWIFLLVVAVGFYGVIQWISRASLRRLEGSGTSTAEQEKKKEARRDRKAETVAEKERKAAEKEERADGEKRRPPRKGKKGKKGRTPAPAKAAEEAAAEEAVKDAGLLLPKLGKSLNEGLSKTKSEGFVGRLSKLFAGKQIDEALLDEVEEVLFTADIGVKTSDKLLTGLRAKLSRKELSDSRKVWDHLRLEAKTMLDGVEQGKSLALEEAGAGNPFVVLVIGVNGAGKTTTIGKLAHRLVADGKSVLVGAGDTYRAAAVDQLEVWARRVGAEVVTGAEGADPSSVLFDACRKAKEKGIDCVLLDTAGRLHTNANLVEELKKVGRVIGKALPGAPHEVLLVLDATNGQNAIQQAQIFREAMGVSGIALTKLDGTAKGGVVLGIYDELKIPIRWIGIGERTEDLRPFDKSDFVQALFDGT